MSFENNRFNVFNTLELVDKDEPEQWLLETNYMLMTKDAWSGKFITALEMNKISDVVDYLGPIVFDIMKRERYFANFGNISLLCVAMRRMTNKDLWYSYWMLMLQLGVPKRDVHYFDPSESSLISYLIRHILNTLDVGLSKEISSEFFGYIFERAEKKEVIYIDEVLIPNSVSPIANWLCGRVNYINLPKVDTIWVQEFNTEMANAVEFFLSSNFHVTTGSIIENTVHGLLYNKYYDSFALYMMMMPQSYRIRSCYGGCAYDNRRFTSHVVTIKQVGASKWLNPDKHYWATDIEIRNRDLYVEREQHITWGRAVKKYNVARTFFVSGTVRDLSAISTGKKILYGAQERKCERCGERAWCVESIGLFWVCCFCLNNREGKLWKKQIFLAPTRKITEEMGWNEVYACAFRADRQIEVKLEGDDYWVEDEGYIIR